LRFYSFKNAASRLVETALRASLKTGLCPSLKRGLRRFVETALRASLKRGLRRFVETGAAPPSLKTVENR